MGRQLLRLRVGRRSLRATHGAVASWSEEQLLDLATSMPAMRTTRRLPRAPRLRTSAILQHHSHCPTRWVKQRDPESLQAVFAAARWAWLGPNAACPGPRR